MKRIKNPYQGSKCIIEDESTYEDHTSILLINIIVELIIQKTLVQAEAIHEEKISNENNH
ncbi:MAG TPA: hypothetical protein VGN00_11910 [Puia sp.]